METIAPGNFILYEFFLSPFETIQVIMTSSGTEFHSLILCEEVLPFLPVDWIIPLGSSVMRPWR